MLIQLALALAATAPALDDVPRGTVRGTVVSEPSGLPVQMAVVEVRTEGGAFTAIADASGAYVLHKIPAGRSTVRVRHLEHAPLEMELLVPARGMVALDLVMEHRPIILPRVQVAAITGTRDSVAAHRADVAVLDVRAMEAAATPGTVFSAGEGNGTDPGAEEDFYVRGSAADLQLVLLDGAPIYAPFHMGGLIESFDPGVLRSARLYLGGAPARYDGGLSYVMDLTTRSPNRERHAASGAVDMLAVRGMLEGPLPRGAAYLVSGRGIHGAGVSSHEGDRFPYLYRDGVARVQVPVGHGGALSFTGFVNSEAVRQDTVGGRNDGGSWSNTAGSARYRGRVEGADTEVTVAVGRYDALLPVRYRGRDLHFTASVDRLRVQADFLRPLAGVRLRYGVGHDRTWTLHEGIDLADQSRTHNRSTGAVTGVYVEGTWQAEPRVVLRGGLRADVFSIDINGVLAPRFSLTWLLSENAALTLAGGRYHQYVRIPSRLTGTAPADTFARAIRLPMDLTVAGATHLTVALDQEIADGLRLGLEGYYKEYTGLPTVEDGRAFSSGMDVWVRRGTGDVTGWIGYSLGWNWSLYTPRETAQRFHGRQLLSAGLNAPVARLASVGLRVAYGAGLPGGGTLAGNPATPEPSWPGLAGSSSFTTPVDLDTDAPLSAWRQGPYLRLDAEVSRTWNPRVGGRITRMTPYVRVVNALDRRDALFHSFDDTAPGGTRRIAALPVVPVAGVQWHF